MKPLAKDMPSAWQTLNRRSADFCAIVFEKVRAEICAPACFAALLLACIPAANAANLGRIFFTPEQRKQLDYAYARNAPVEGSSSPFLTVNGIVQKQGGARTVWINGVPQNMGKSRERNPAAETVTVSGKSHPIRIKVGEKILLDQPAPKHQDAASD